jgi:hypothetical protein
MTRTRLVLLGMVALIASACDTTPSVEYRLVNPSKPISEYDSDLYKCTMMAKEMYPPPPGVRSDSMTCRKVFSDTTRCSADIVQEESWNTRYLRESKITDQARNCMVRQGWTKEAVVNESPKPSSVRDDIPRKYTIQGDRKLNSACLDNGQCSDGLSCIYDMSSGYKRCLVDEKRDTGDVSSKSSSNKKKSSVYDKSRGEDSACVDSGQCLTGLSCVYDANVGYKRCKSQP